MLHLNICKVETVEEAARLAADRFQELLDRRAHV